MDPNYEDQGRQGMLPPMSQPQMEQAPVSTEAPSPSVSFDVQKNPQDMQLMTDVAVYAPMLKQMTPEQRAEKWPEISKKLVEVNPKVQGMIDPTLPPGDKDLDMLLNRMPGNKEGTAPQGPMTQVADISGQTRAEFLQAQVKRQLEGKAPVSQDQWEKEKADAEAAKKSKATNMSNEDFIQSAAYTAGVGTKFLNNEPGIVGKALNAVGEVILPSAYAYGEDDDKPKAPTNYEYVIDANGNQKLQPIKDGPADLKVISDQAAARKAPTAPTEGQVALARAAENLLPLLKKLPFNDDYTLNRSALLLPKYGVLNEKGTIYDDSVTKVAQSFLRFITGATAPDKEVTTTKDMIQCKATDTPDICAQKYIFADTFFKSLPSLQRDDPSTKTGKNLDIDKAKALQQKTQTAVILYKDKWMTKQQQQYPNASTDDLNKLWTKSVLTSPEFVQKVTADMDKEGN